MSITFPFFDYLQNETVVLTPNRRLSATLLRLYQQHQVKQGNVTWRTPQILPLNSWLNSLWQQAVSPSCLTAPLLLNPAQEAFLWEKILRSNQENEALLQISEAAQLAQSAFSLLNQWQVDWTHSLFQTSQDTQALQRWILAFLQLCKEHNWIDMSSLMTALMPAIKTEVIMLPKRIILFGLTEYPPQLMQFLSLCETHHSHVEKINHQVASMTCKRINCADKEDEILTAARWAKQYLHDFPEAAIACVFPSLDKIRDRVAQIFSDVLATEVFNISAGKSFASYPVIHAALVLLQLHDKKITSELITYLLTSPFLGEAESENIQRAQCDARHRFANQNRLDLSAVGQYCPLLAKRLRAFFQLVDSYEDKATYNQWADRWHQLLTSLGWPGERSLNSDEYQLVETWLNLLNEYKSLDFVSLDDEKRSEPVDLSSALYSLHKMAAHFQFQPQSPTAPIQILGVLEAAGMPFDALWVAGMDDLAWPPPPRPNPFIPRRLQRENQMPHATAERELHFCRLLTQQFKQAAQHVVFSHADKREELILQPSPLIKDIIAMTQDSLHLSPYQSPALGIFHSKQMEIMVDDKAPGLQSHEKPSGGMSVIQYQALCPFKAFANWRLHARELETFMPGLKAKERGTAIHKALEIIWQQLQNHEAVSTISDHDLQTVIHTGIDAALQRIFPVQEGNTNYIALEKQRLQGLLWEWLQIEKQRQPFKVLMNEKSSQVTFGPLTLTIRMDRVDELDNGKKLVVDYKTGRNNDINHWFGERLEAPQLPLYALLDTHNTCGIAFAQIYPGEYGFKGVSETDIDITGIKPFGVIKKITALSWQGQLQEWHTVLTQLSEQFYAGHAAVDPKDTSQTCGFCTLQSLCRINDVMGETCSQH